MGRAGEIRKIVCIIIGLTMVSTVLTATTRGNEPAFDGQSGDSTGPGIQVDPSGMITDLMQEIITWDLQKGATPSLTSKLLDAKRLLDRGNEKAAIHKMRDFVSLVSSMEGKKLTPDQVAYCVSSAEAIIDLIKGLPVAVISGPSQTRANQVVEFDGLSSMYSENPLSEWRWDMGDGVTMTGAIVEHSYTVMGDYEVFLVVTDVTGRESSPASHSIAVLHEMMPPVVVFTATVSHMEVTVDAPGSYDPDGLIAAYDWDFGDGGIGSGITAIHTYAAPGNYTIVLRLTDNDGLVNTTSGMVEIVDSPPVAWFTYTEHGRTVYVNATGSSDDYGITDYMWDWGDGTTGTGMTASHTYSPPSVQSPSAASPASEGPPPPPYMVVGYTNDSDGIQLANCTVKVTDLRTGGSLTVLSHPEGVYLVEDLHAIPGDFLNGDVIEVTATKGSLSGSAEGIAHSSSGYLWLDVVLEPFVAIDYFTITLTATDTIGQTGNLSQTVAIAPAPVASFTCSVDGPIATVDASESSGAGGIVSYAWDWGDGQFGSGVTATHTYVTPGMFTIVLTITDTLDQTGTCMVQVAIPPFVLTFTHMVDGSTVHVDASGSAGGTWIDTITWYWGDGTSSSGVIASHVYASAGFYEIVLLVTYGDGYSYSTSTLVEVMEPWERRTVNYVWYDMFNVPLGEWYDTRWNRTGTEEPLTDSYPYLYVWHGAPLGNDVVYTNMRLNISGWNIPEINMNNSPEFLPLFGTERGGNAAIDWYMQYMTSEEVGARFPPAVSVWNDGWFVNWKGTVILDRQAAKAVLGITDQQFDDFTTWWAVNNGTVSDAYRGWITQESYRLDIFPMYDYELTWIDWIFWCEKAWNGIVIHMDTVSWGMEAMMTRWMHESFMPTEWYFEDMDFNLWIHPEESEIAVDTAVEYAAYAWEDAGEPCWVWEAMMQDYMQSTWMHPHSDYDKYAPFQYLNMVPGSMWYGQMMHYDYTPGAWNLSVGESLRIEWPAGQQLFLKHVSYGVRENLTGAMSIIYMEPDESDFPSQIAVDQMQRSVTFTGPIDMWTWARDQTTHSILASEWDRIGLLPWGIPYIEFGMSNVTPSAEPDVYEPDDSYLEASSISLGETQTHSIHNMGADWDWVTFTLSETTTVTIRTLGVPGWWTDTVIALYGIAGVPFSPFMVDDDSGGDLTSMIMTALPAGTYWVQVWAYQQQGEIVTYYLELAAGGVLAEFCPPHYDYGLDTDNDTLYNHLVVEASVSVFVPGYYTVAAGLYDSSGIFSIEGAGSSVYLSQGVHTVQVLFTGFRIFESGFDGPYHVNLYLQDAALILIGTDEHTTQAYMCAQFQPPGAELVPPHSDQGMDTDDDGLYEALAVDVSISVAVPGLFSLTANLLDGSGSIFVDSAVNTTYLSLGMQTVRVVFQSAGIVYSGLDGPYLVQLYLNDGIGNWICTGSHTTQAYSNDQFQLPPVDIVPQYSDYGRDTDGDSFFNQLVVEVLLTVNDAGDYRVAVDIYDFWGTWITGAESFTHLEPGTRTVQVILSGTVIRSVGLDPYLFKITLRDAWGAMLDSATYTTSAHPWYLFDAQLDFMPPHSDRVVDTNGDGMYDYLVIEAVINTSSSGYFYVSCLLFDQYGYGIGSLYNYTYLGVGLQTVEFSFDGIRIRSHGVDGPYRADLSLYDSMWMFLAWGNHTTAPYLWSEFQTPPAAFAPPHSDYGLDTNADGLYEFLVVEVCVDVAIPGNYSVYGEFHDSNWSWVWWAYNNTYLEQGLNTVDLKVDGWRIYLRGTSGPFSVALTLRGGSGNWSAYDSYNTSAYLWSDFARASSLSPPYSDYGLDVDGDGFWNYLVIQVGIDAASPGDYYVSAGMFDQLWNWMDSASTYVYLDAGIQTVELTFDGMRIRTHEVDGPYHLDLTLSDASLNWLDNDDYTTGPYLWDEFERPGAVFEAPHSDYGLDTNGDGLYDYLVAEVVVNVTEAGFYEVSASLRAYSGMMWIAYSSNFTYLDAGLQIVILQFDGMEIRRNGADGPYTVDMSISFTAPWTWLDSDIHTTMAYLWTEFQNPPAIFEPPHSDYGLDTNGDGLYDQLVINVSVTVSSAGNYHIAADLFNGSLNGSLIWITAVTSYAYLEPGAWTVQVIFAGDVIRTSDLDGPYSVLLLLYTETGVWLGSDSHITKAYSWDEFQPRAAELMPPYSDYGLDTNGDGLYDYLVFEAVVNVTEAGFYDVSATLRDYYGMLWIAYAYGGDNFSYLDVGVQVVILRFDGMEIRRSGIDGPYSVYMSIYDTAPWTWLDSDIHITKAYMWTEFQNPPAILAPPHSDYGVDTNGDGFYDQLAIDVSVAVSAEGEYYIGADLYSGSPNGSLNWIWSATGNATLGPGTHAIQVVLPGDRVRASGVDGPYFVRLYLYTGTGLGLGEDSYFTRAYSWEEFQVPAADLVPPYSDYGLDSDADGLYDYLVVEATVNVSMGGDYRLSALLLTGDGTFGIATQSTSTHLDPGTHAVQVYLDGFAIRDSGIDGPYLVQLELRNIANWTFLELVNYPTQAYSHDQFQPAPAELAGTYTEYCLDTDSDGYYNYLVVDVSVSVVVADDYRLSGYLCYGSWSGPIAAGCENYTHLEPGLQIVQLLFKGLDIRGSGLDGPYYIHIEFYNATGSLLGYGSSLTQNYTWDQFQPPPAVPAELTPPYADYGLDTNGDGLYEYLVVEAMVSVSEGGVYALSATLFESNGTWITNLYNNTYLDPGVWIVQVCLPGIMVHSSGFDGPYRLQLDLYISAGPWLDSDTCSTQAYSCDQFEPPPAELSTPSNDYGLDTDGDGLYDYLVVEVSVIVSAAGDYHFYSNLQDSSWNPAAWTQNTTYLETGLQIVRLMFRGDSIRYSGLNGPYNVHVDLSAWMGSPLDWEDYVTQAYSWDQFQPPKYSITAVAMTKGAADNTGDSLMDLSAVDGMTYDVLAGQTLEIDTWHVGGILDETALLSAALVVTYAADTDYQGDRTILWSSMGMPLSSTGIMPVAGDGPGLSVTIDLFFLGVRTVGDLRDLNLQFTNVGTLESGSVHFDSIQIVFTAG